MVHSNASLLLEELDQQFVLPLDFVRGGVDVVDNLLVSQALQLVLVRHPLVELVEHVLELLLNVVYHLVPRLNRYLPALFRLLLHVLLLDHLLENPFVV